VVAGHVPGTAAGALAAAGLEASGATTTPRTGGSGASSTPTPRPGVLLTLEGVASVADVYLNGEPVAHGENMFRTLRTEVAPWRSATS